MKEGTALHGKTDLLADGGQAELADILAVYGDVSFLRIVEAGDEFGQGGFSGATSAYEGNRGVRMDGEVDILQNRGTAVVGEADVVELDFTSNRME